MMNQEQIAVALSAISLSTVDVERLKLALMDKEIDPGQKKTKALVKLALENDIEVPLVQPEPVVSEGETGTVDAAEADETETPEAAEADDATPEAGEVEAAEAEPKTSRNVVPQKYRQRYGAAQNNGDKVAKILADHTKNKDGTANPTAIEAVAVLNGIDFEKYRKLNVGMQRMNVGNVLRGKLNRGERVVIGDTIFEAKDKEADDGKSAQKL